MSIHNTSTVAVLHSSYVGNTPKESYSHVIVKRNLRREVKENMNRVKKFSEFLAEAMPMGDYDGIGPGEGAKHIGTVKTYHKHGDIERWDHHVYHHGGHTFVNSNPTYRDGGIADNNPDYTKHKGLHSLGAVRRHMQKHLDKLHSD